MSESELCSTEREGEIIGRELRKMVEPWEGEGGEGNRSHHMKRRDKTECQKPKNMES